MLHPVGRLPSQIYWRRRLLLIVLVAAIGITAVVLSTNGSSSASGDGSGAIVAETSSAATTDGRMVPGLEQVVPSLVPAESGSSGSSGGETGSGDSGTGAPGAGAPGTTSSAPPPPAEPGPCPDEAIGLTAASEFGQYAAGSKPLLSLTIANVSAVPCYRDLNLFTQVWGLFTTDGTRLWGSNDCFPEPDVPNSQLLQPGQALAFSIVWSGLTSEAGCPPTRQVLGPGTYVLRGYLGSLFSPDVPLVIV